MNCQIADCDTEVSTFDEQFPPPEDAEVEEGVSRAEGIVMCDHHHVAAKLVAYTRGEPPYVDMGLYQEVAYYARALGAETFEIPAEDLVTAPQNHEEDDEST